ncbi:Holliday junction branch migration protein RuvA [Sandaracinobacter neustonicus]|uniref:Holliday junction branch migration complex subunit RuvA n=1 Tax=Sandaracinobacter neustonicus TaxID=1715348 RepID=A0A501XIH0_9SPHN|nr:Holliday junction branch migration protein RuvA [Sandaracinobacter neustonicus]TPE60103.1 Holliday junction branch migration protein RuvA [Sandaracinobacter neustonicus]
MIASLKGTVQAIGADHAVIEVGGVGYLVQASGRTLSALEPGAGVFLLVETQVREDAITLFGFGTSHERDWFRLLTGVQGVGGKLALAILGTLAPDEIARAITLDDKAMIARAPGVGPRLAVRILTELKGKAPAAGGLSERSPLNAARPHSSEADAIAALESLGFRTAEAARAVAQALRDLGEDQSTPNLIRESLKRASR